MPFIRGRYHINAVAGEALEAAREAEAALLALEHDTEQDDEGNDFGDGDPAGAGKGPIHRVEIEAAELVPPQPPLGNCPGRDERSDAIPSAGPCL